MLNQYVGPTFLPIYAKTNCNLYFTCHCQICTRNKYDHQIEPICYRHQILKCMNRGCMKIYMPHMKSLASTMQQGALNTYLTYITQQIWLPHSKYSTCSQHAVLAYRPNSFAYICQNRTNWNFHFTCYCLICARIKYAHQNVHICHMC